jgi:hypothetical protein
MQTNEAVVFWDNRASNDRADSEIIIGPGSQASGESHRRQNVGYLGVFEEELNNKTPINIVGIGTRSFWELDAGEAQARVGG